MGVSVCIYVSFLLRDAGNPYQIVRKISSCLRLLEIWWACNKAHINLISLQKNVHLCRADKLKPDIRIKMSSALFFRYQALNPAAA